MKKKWSDMEAFAVYEDTVHVPSNLFKGTAGPKMSEVYQGACKEWDDLWDDKQADHTRQCCVLKSGSSNVLQKFGQEAKEQAACSRLDTARSNMTDKRKQLDATRSVQLIKSVKKQKDAAAKKEAEVAQQEEAAKAATAANDAGEEGAAAVP